MDAFVDRLAAGVRRVGNPVLVGLDPRADLLPEVFHKSIPAAEGAERRHGLAGAYRDFCRGIIDVVAPLVAIVKPQAAFFEQLGPSGMLALADTIAYANAQGLLVVLDGKRNDIGSTAAAYADGLLGAGEASPWGADALTVSPYLGDDSLAPFAKVASARQAGIFVLVKTSNPGGKTFQDLVADGRPVYAHVADLVEQMAVATQAKCGYGDVGAVAGATYPQQLGELRTIMPHTWFLVPGFGAQGGTAADVAGAFDARGMGAIVNSSRGIIFAHQRPEYAGRPWQQAVEAATLDMIEQLRADTPAARLASI